MSHKHLYWIILLSIIATTIVAKQWPTNANAQQPQRSMLTISSWQQLEAKAALARTGNNDSVRVLVHGMFDSFSWANREEISGEIEDRISRAELSYRASELPAIQEANVVKTINDLAEQLGTPEFTRTDMQQVRYLRAALMTQVPSLSTNDKLRQNAVPHAMSPVEATYVTMLLIHQKLYNPYFQMTPSQWRQMRYKENWNMWNNHRLGKDTKPSNGPTLMSSPSTPQSDAIRKTITNIATRWSAAEVSSIPDAMLDKLGVTR